MDFVSFIRAQRQKLHFDEYVTYLWEESQEEDDGDIDIDTDEDNEPSGPAIEDFQNHLPICYNQFWKDASEKLNEAPEDVLELDDDLRQYMLVLLYHCFTKDEDYGTDICLMHAAEVYIGLLVKSQAVEKLFTTSKLYRHSLRALQKSVDVEFSRESTKRLVQKLKLFYAKSNLSIGDLEHSVAMMLHIVYSKTEKVYEPRFNTDQIPESYVYNALLAIKVLYMNEKTYDRRQKVLLYLFNGLIKRNLQTPSLVLSWIQTNLRNLMKSLDATFKENDYRMFMNCFMHVWNQPDFAYYSEAVLILNGLRENHYRTLVDMLQRMMKSKPTRHLVKLSTAIVFNPARHIPPEKIKVTNQILIRGVLIQVISTKIEVCNSAIESFGEILSSANLKKDYIYIPLKKIFEPVAGNVLKVSTVLLGLKASINKIWTYKSKNKIIFGITITLMQISDVDYCNVYYEVLELLGDEAKPLDLKPFLPLLSETYIKLSLNKNVGSALLILRLIFKMALDSSPASTIFLRYLFSSMTTPVAYKDMKISSGEYFIDPIISTEFNYAEFFENCRSLGLIREEQVRKLLVDLPHTDLSNLRLLCVIVHLTEYKDLSPIAEHVNRNFKTIQNNPAINYLLYAYSQILENNLVRKESNRRNDEIITYFLRKHLLEQNLIWDAVPNGMALLKKMDYITNLENDFERFKQEYDKKLIFTLQNQGSCIPILYYSQLVLFGSKLPSDEAMALTTAFLKLCSNQNYRRSQRFNPKLWIACLVLYTNICIMKHSIVESGLEFLQKGLESSVMPVKFAAINLSFDLCNMVTHNFEDLIKFMFRQLVLGDNVFKRTCIVKIDRLIRDDYLKLELEQFIIFFSILGDRSYGLADYLNHLFEKSIYINGMPIVAKFFVPFLVHINGYTKHPVYKISRSSSKAVLIMAKKISDKQRIYDLLFGQVQMKQKFNILYALSENILEKVIKGAIKCDNGYWNMVKDCIQMFRMTASIIREVNSYQIYHKKIMNQINKFILQKTEFKDLACYLEHRKEVIYCTITLIKLLLFSASNNDVHKHIGVSAFDAIMCWTDFLLSDFVHLVHTERVQDLQLYYSKVDVFYKKNVQNLKMTEEKFATNIEYDPGPSTSSTSGIAFNIEQNTFLPQLEAEQSSSANN